MTSTHQRLLTLLQRYLSSVNAEVALNRALRECNVLPQQLTVRELAQLIPRLSNSIRLFVAPERQEALNRELDDLSRRGQTPETHTIPVKGEEDISKARMIARTLSEDFGASGVTAQKIATIVSELARNIVSYTSGGDIILGVIDTVPRKVRVQARDNGPGVSNLEDIMSGKYKSKSGLGKGLLGVKRLANRFDIQTDERGTTVEALVWL
jgi:serine/threonine-protein kinase RsbT